MRGIGQNIHSVSPVLTTKQGTGAKRAVKRKLATSYVLTNPSDIPAALSAMSLITFMGLYLLIYCGASQILIDHSISIHACIYNSQWYGLTPKTQKILQCMMMRCNVPCQLTAGNILIMSMRTLWLMAKTYLSFFAFVRSTQGL